jgi:bifunctional DNA-binding transcriptional regulator/antitoxin component of YhaV-PrlF toxin-antitoxin module
MSNMPKSPDTSTVNQSKGQTSVTVPKPIAEAMNLKAGQKVKWKVTGKGKLELNTNQ